MAGEFVGLVQQRVGIEIDAQTPVVVPVVDKDRQVLDGAVRQVVRRRRVAAERKVEVERLDIHSRPRHLLIGVEQAERAAQVLVAELLVAKCAAHVASTLRHRIGQGHARREAETHHDRVRDHGRYRPHRVSDPSGHRHAERQVGRSRDAVHIDGHQRDQDLRQGPADLARERHQALGQRRVQQRGVAQERAGSGSARSSQRHRTRKVGQLLEPVGAVTRMPVRRAIGRFHLQQCRKPTERVGGSLLAGDQGIVMRRKPVRDQAAREPVHDHVMAAMVPHEVRRTEADQRGCPKRIATETDRTRQLGAHPCQGLRERIVLPGEVEQSALPLETVADQLPRSGRLLDQTCP